MAWVSCEGCGEEREHYAKGLCSTCYKHQQHYSENRRCDCGKLITNTSMTCRSCASKLRSSLEENSHRGKNNPHWKGGVVERGNRVYVYAPDNSMSDGQGYVRRGRLVLAEKLGRLLKPEEICHHINLDSKDDRPSNLELFPDHSKHTKHHQRIKKIHKLREWLTFERHVPTLATST